jgi:ATP-dependent RNA helicase DeaD
MAENSQLTAISEGGVGAGPASFEEFGLLPEVAEAIAKLGFETPTPVQSRTYADVMGGDDVVVMAQTGTGKTAAFGIPLAQRLEPQRKRVQALALTPTRELALQVSREVSAIGKGRGISAAAVYGGASFTKQVEQVSAGAQIVVGTPGRVLDHMRRGTIKFDGVAVLVLDEADEMLSMGFEKELSEIIEGLPKKRQNMLFSATIPDDIQRLAGRYMSAATLISVSGDAVAAAEISHYVYLVSGLERLRDLVKVIELERPESAIIFCNTRDETQGVARYLKDAGYNADWINSDLSQAERERVLGKTRRGALRFMVATDVAARGIDISHLSHVINYSFPESLEVYVHRTGRTGRLGRHGAAVSLITPHDIGNLYFLRLTYKIFPVEKLLPDSADVMRNLELERLELLRGALLGQPDGEFVGLARRVIQDLHVEELIAGLLRGHFGAGPGAAAAKPDSTRPAETAAPAVPPATSKARPAAKKPAVAKETAATREQTAEKPAAGKEPVKKAEVKEQPAEKPAAKKTAAEKAPAKKAEVKEQPAEKPAAKKTPTRKAAAKKAPAKKAAAKKTPAKKAPAKKAAAKKAPAKKAAAKKPAAKKTPAKKAAAKKAPAEPSAAREIFVDAGRKDGLRISTLMKDIVEATGLPRSAMGRVRMLTRATFIAVPDEHFDQVLKALCKVKVDGRRLKAEPAEGS